MPYKVSLIITIKSFKLPYLLESFVGIPYLYFERNKVDNYEFVSKNIIRIEHDNYSCTLRSYARTHARTRARRPNQKKKLHGRKIRRTLLYRSVREIVYGTVPFGIDKTDGSHAQRTRKSN